MKKIIITLLFMFCLVSLASAEFLRDPIVTSTSGIWTDVRAYSGLDDLLSSIGTANQTIYINNDVSVTDNLAIPSNIELHFLAGGKISIDNATATVTVNGTISAGSFRVFEGNGTLAGNPNNEFVYNTWHNGTSLTVTWPDKSLGSQVYTYFTNGTVRLEDLGNVNSSMSPGDGDVLMWNATLGVWDKFSGSSVTSLGALSDVNGTMAPTGGNALFYNGTTSLWDAAVLELGVLSDVSDSLTPHNGDALIYNSTTGTWNASTSNATADYAANASYAITAVNSDTIDLFHAATAPAVSTCPAANSTDTKILSTWLFPFRNCTTNYNSTLFNATVGDTIILGQNNTCNLPLTPDYGDQVFFKAGGDWTLDGNNATIQGNGNKVGNSTATILELDILRGFTCIWNGDFWGLD